MLASVVAVSFMSVLPLYYGYSAVKTTRVFSSEDQSVTPGGLLCRYKSKDCPDADEMPDTRLPAMSELIAAQLVEESGLVVN